MKEQIFECLQGFFFSFLTLILFYGMSAEKVVVFAMLVRSEEIMQYIADQ